MIYGTPEDNFFEKNDDHRYITEVGELIMEYGVELAGKYMWAIWLVYHPASSLFEMELADKIDWVKANYLNDPAFEWPEKKVILKAVEKKPGKKKKGLDDEFDDEEMENDEVDIDIDLTKKKEGYKEKDLQFKVMPSTFYDVIEVFPLIAMSVEERDYYSLVRLRQLAQMRMEYLNGKDLAAAVKMLSSSSPDMDKMKERYLVWKENASSRSSGEIQSGWASKLKNKFKKTS